MDRRCVIISGGDFHPIKGISRKDYVIACDRGYAYAARCGIVPDLVVGDFDSYEGGIPETVPTVIYPREKDDTDTMIAVRTAVEKGFDEAIIYCALGGRFDHAFSNIQAAAFAVKKGLKVIIEDDHTQILFADARGVHIPKREGWSLSVFSLDDESTGVVLRGTKYTREGGTLHNTFPIGACNEWAEDSAFIQAERGLLMVVLSQIDR
jgi:thiamine pyrophosphokinase